MCKFKTDINFKGKTALDKVIKVNQVPLKRRLLGFTVEDPTVDLNGGEVIYRDGSRIAGYIKRCGYGYTINKHIGFGYVELEKKERKNSIKQALAELMKSKYELEIMGKRVVAEPFVKAPYDSQRLKIMA